MQLVAAIITFFAVLVALCIGVSSIRQTREIQKRERRERLLNEIIDWAMDITKCEVLLEIEDLAAVKDIPNKEILRFTLTDKEHYIYKELKRKSNYIYRASFLFGQDLQLSIEKIIKCLEKHVTLISQYKKAHEKDIRSMANKVDKNKEMLDKLAEEVLGKTTKIKTEEIAK